MLNLLIILVYVVKSNVQTRFYFRNVLVLLSNQVLPAKKKAADIRVRYFKLEIDIESSNCI